MNRFSNPAADQRSPTSALQQFTARAVRAVRRAHDIHRRKQLLRQMPDELLKDIGISRCEIDSIAISLADGRPDRSRRARGLGRI